MMIYYYSLAKQEEFDNMIQFRSGHVRALRKTSILRHVVGKQSETECLRQRSFLVHLSVTASPFVRHLE